MEFDPAKYPGTGAGQIEQQIEGGGIRIPAPAGPAAPVYEEDGSLPDNVEELSLRLENVIVEGSTVYTKEDFAPLYEHRIGKDIALAFVFKIADMITAKYRNDGYILSRAIVPPQTIENGTVTIKIVEGYINEIRIEGEIPEHRPLLDAYVDKILNSRPLSIKDMERYLLLFRDLPGIESKALVSPAKDASGASDLTIQVEFKAVDKFIRYDNRGSDYNGPGRLWLGAGFNSFGNNHQRTALAFATAGSSTKELRYFDFGHERHIGDDGKKLYVNITRTNSQPGHILRSLNITSNTQSFKVGISKPLIRSRTKNLWIFSDFVVRNSETKINIEQLSKDRIRFLSIGALYDSLDRFGGINQVGIRIDQGVDGLGASKENTVSLSRTTGQVDFTKLWLTASRLQQLDEQWSILTSLTSQFASSKLLASEEFGVGGEHCVRAYDPSELTGDEGACLLVEVRFGENIDLDSLVGYQLYGYYDVGNVKRKGIGALGRKASLSSAGLGARMNFKDWLSGSIEVAWPRKKEVDSRPLEVDSSRLFLNLTAQF